jgi:hypothetical protein
MLVSPFLFWLFPLIVLLRTGGGGQWGDAALAATVVSAVFWMVVSAAMRIPAIYGLGYPLGAAVALFIALRSIWRGARRVEWRGRVYGSSGTG